MLNLTNQRVLWDPSSTPLPFIKALSELFGKKPAGDLAEAGVNAVGSWDPIAIPLDSLASVEAIGGSRLRLTKQSKEVWDLTILGGHFGLRGSEGSVAARDEAVGDIRLAIAGGTPAPPPAPILSPPMPPGSPWTTTAPASGAAAADEQIDWGALLIRLAKEAEVTGKPVTFHEDDQLSVYVMPTRTLRTVMGWRGPQPPDATHLSALEGFWLTNKMEDPENLEFRADGSVVGLIQLFGLLPPKPVTGQWWWQGIDSRLTFTYVWSIALAEVDPQLAVDYGWWTGTFEIGMVMRLTYVGRNTLVGVSETELEPGGLVLRRRH